MLTSGMNGIEGIRAALMQGGLPMGNRAKQPSPARMTPAALQISQAKNAKQDYRPAAPQQPSGGSVLGANNAGGNPAPQIPIGTVLQDSPNKFIDPIALGLTGRNTGASAVSYLQNLGLDNRALNSYGIRGMQGL